MNNQCHQMDGEYGGDDDDISTSNCSNYMLCVTYNYTENEEVNDDYKPNSILLETVKAIEIDDEKEENIYIYFKMPNELRGEEIAFKIKYINNDEKKEEEYIEQPLILSKALIPISFQIITSSTIDDEEYESNPSEIITIGYKIKTPSPSPLPPKPVPIPIKPIEIDEKDMELPMYNLQIISMNKQDIRIKFDAPKSPKKQDFYVHVVGKEDQDLLIKFKLKKNIASTEQNIDIKYVRKYINDNDNIVVISVYKQHHDTDYIATQIKIQIPIVNEDYIMSYKPNTISIESVKVIKNNSDVYIYWDNPISLYGNIKYKIYKYSSVVIGYKCPNYKYSHRYEPIFELKVTPHHKQQPFTKLNKQRIEGLRNGWDYNFKVKAKNKLGGLGCEISFTIFTYSASLIVLCGILFLICIIILLLSIWWIYSNRSYKTIKALSNHWNEYNRIEYICNDSNRFTYFGSFFTLFVFSVVVIFNAKDSSTKMCEFNGVQPNDEIICNLRGDAPGLVIAANSQSEFENETGFTITYSNEIIERSIRFIYIYY